MLKRLLVLLACLLPHLAVAAPKGFPNQFELASLDVKLTWQCDKSACAYEGTYQDGKYFYTIKFEVGDSEEHRVIVKGEDAYGNTISFRFVATGDPKDGFYLHEDDSGLHYDKVTDPFSDYDFLEPVGK
jgi:hypothetical protein